MEQLIFVGLILLFSVIDMIAKSRRGKDTPPDAETAEASLPDEDEAWEIPDARPRRTPLPSRLPSREDGEDVGEPWRHPHTDQDRDPVRVLTDLFETLESSERTERAEETAAARMPLPVPVAVEPVAVEPEHYIHAAHAGYHTDPSERAPAVVETSTPAVVSEAAHIARDLAAGGRDAARRALIMSEVFGPPVSVRDGDGWPPLG